MSRPSPRHGFTLVELLIVMAVMGILSALLLPAINSSRERGRQSVCGARVQQIGIALTKASANKKGKTRTVDGQQVNLLDPRYLQPDATASEDWRKKGVLAAELQDEAEIWRCPSNPNADTPSFGFNARISGLGSRDGARLVVLEYNPIKVIVEVEPELALELYKLRLEGKFELAEILLKFSDGTIYQHPGEYIGSSHRVNRKTGKVNHQVLFPNADLLILPGSTVTVIAKYGDARQ